MHFSELDASNQPGTAVAVQPAIHRLRGRSVIPRPIPSPKHRARSQGFSMVEAMAVIAIIGFMSMLVLPSVGTMIAENHQYRSAVEVMLAARRARVEAMFSGYASALHYVLQPDGAVIVPVTGLTTRCNRGDNGQYDFLSPVPLPRGWQELVGSPPILMSQLNVSGQSIRSQLTFNGAAVNVGFLCWEPRGECWYSTTPWNAGPANPDTVMLFNRFNTAGNQVGTERQVVFPASCTARVR